KVDFYDHSMKLLKTQTAHNVKPIKGKLMRADKVLMTHHQNKHQTLMGLVDRKIDGNIDDSIFTERAVTSFK
ncbi:MAG: outer membrane lipoprotein-sorting protein, partial [Nitrospirae bacterium]|nr:outer membrane lipoprotein-sorting protein [Nitrospirota bacterium]